MFKKTFSLLLLLVFLSFQIALPVRAQVAEDISPTPVPETTPVESISPTNVPEPSPTPGTPLPSPTMIPAPIQTRVEPTMIPTPSQALPPTQPSVTPVPGGNQTGGQTQVGGNGDTVVATGNANNSATVVTTGNTNTGVASTSGPSIGVINEDNGAQSNSNGEANSINQATTGQTNSAAVLNNLNLSSTTGNNAVLLNNGGTAGVLTGDANVSGTAITAVNTNLDGVSVSEFNIADTHMGDYVLDFAANCIVGCGSNLSTGNTNNGANSNNDANVNQLNEQASFQNNDASVGNNLVLKADTGANDASLNTGGDNLIATGNANVSANSLTFANNNIAGGQVKYGVVNIYGQLLGDIIFPEELLGNCCTNDVTAQNSGNGTSSNNNASISNSNADSTSQNNEATIDNSVNLNANTGANDATGNTGGSSDIITGSTDVVAQVLNVANNNVAGNNLWLVLVNNAGEWMGQILGVNPNQNYAGSSGTQFTVSPTGQITASNNGNGAGSTNDSSVNKNDTQTTNQTNNANIQNNLDLSANTGGNDAKFNTGGDTVIKTGDANIIANLVNFVNNNISGGNLFVTVVNVFGGWVGDFVTPGSTPKAKNNQPIGGSNISQVNTTTTSSTTQNNPSAIPTLSPAPTKKPAITFASASQTKLSKPTGFGPTSKPEVASFTTELEPDFAPSTTAKKVIKINLAWLLLLLPAIGILGFLKRRASPAKLS